MSINENTAGNDSGTDEEFIDQSLADEALDNDSSKSPARGAKPAKSRRSPKDSKQRPEAEPKDTADAKPLTKPEVLPAVKPGSEAKAPAVGGVEPKTPDNNASGLGAPSKDAAAKQRVAAKEERVANDKATRMARTPKTPKAVTPDSALASHTPGESTTGANLSTAAPVAPRDPGGYPEFHAPTRVRKDGKRAQTIVFLHGGNVANWSWDPQVRAFGDYEVLTPHLPGFGARAQEDWAGLDSAADDVAAVIADEVSNGGAHLVGLSLGGVIALRVLARHPELVESVLISGVPAAGVSASMRTMSRMQLRLFGSEWYWRFQAGAYGMVADEKELFTEHGTHLRADNMRAIMDEVDPGGVPAKLGDYKGPALVIAGGKEPKLVAKSFPALSKVMPQAQFRTAAGMHHQWNIEDPILFNATVRAWIEKGSVHPRLQEPVTQK